MQLGVYKYYKGGNLYMKLPKTFLLFRRVSAEVAIKQPEHPTPKLNVGLFHERMGTQPQLNFLKALQPETSKQVIYSEFDIGKTDTGRGKKDIPDTKDFYIGEML